VNDARVLQGREGLSRSGSMAAAMWQAYRGAAELAAAEAA
jgi:hypothetical protein